MTTAKRNRRFFTTAAITLATVVCLCACGSSGGSVTSSAPYNEKKDAYVSTPEEAAYETEEEYDYMTESAIDAGDYGESALASAMSAPEESGTWEEESDDHNPVTQTSGGGDGSDAKEPDTPADTDSTVAKKTRKLITTVSIEAETEALDGILQRLQSEVAAFGGYIEASNISRDRTYMGGNYIARRTATLTLRVPEAKLETILATVSGETNILEENRSTEDVTLTYVDIESRKKSLETQRDSLMRLMEQAETVEEIITIEDRLSYVNYDIERMGGQLRTYDNLVDYATVHLTLREVVEYTPVQEEPETVVSRITKGFSQNFKRVTGGLVDLFVWFVSSLPQIVVFVIVIVIAVKLLGWLFRRRAMRKAAMRAAMPEGAWDTKPKKERFGRLRGLFGRRKKQAAQEPFAPPAEYPEENGEESQTTQDEI